MKPKKSGGQPNNTNNQKSMLPHIKRLANPEVILEMEVIRAMAGELTAGYTEDLGGDSELSTGERLLLGALTDLVTVRLSLLKDLLAFGTVAVDKKTGLRSMHASVEKMANFISCESRIIRLLGLRRRAKSTNDLERYLNEKKKQSEKEGTKNEEEKGR